MNIDQRQQKEINDLRRGKVGLRYGTIVADPAALGRLCVNLGNSDEMLIDCKSVGGASVAVGDRVPVLVRGNDILVLGGVGDGAGGGGGGPWQPLDADLTTLAGMRTGLASSLAGMSFDAQDLIDSDTIADMRALLGVGGSTGLGIPLYFPEDYGAMADGATDDTDAFRDMLQAIEDSDSGSGEVILTAGKTYLVDGAPDTSKFGNAILPLPLAGGVLGTRGNYPNPVGGTYIKFHALAGTAMIKTTRTSDSYSTTYGPPSVIGGPTEENGADAHHMSTIGTLAFEGVMVVAPPNPHLAGIDAWYAKRFDIVSTTVTTTECEGGVNAPGDVTLPTQKHAFGIRYPNDFVYDHVVCDGAKVNGFYCGFALSHAHYVLLTGSIAFCQVAFGIHSRDPAGAADGGFGGTGVSPTYTDGDTFSRTGHPVNIVYFVVNHNKYTFAGWDPHQNGVKSLEAINSWFVTGGKIDWEVGGTTSPNDWATTADVLDDNDSIYGRLYYHRWPTSEYLPLFGADGTTGGANFDLVSAPVDAIGGEFRSRTGFLADVGAEQSAAFRADNVTALDQIVVAYADSADTKPIFSILGVDSGLISWGPGGTVPTDTSLFRDSAGVLKTQGKFLVDQLTSGGTAVEITTTGTSSLGIAIDRPGGASTGMGIKFDQLDTLDTAVAIYKTSGDSIPMFNIIGANSGEISWGAGGTATLDTTLYRDAANTLRSDDVFIAGGTSGARSVRIGEVGPASEAAITMGTATDATLYRSAASTLRTPGALTVDTALTAQSGLVNQTTSGGTALQVTTTGASAVGIQIDRPGGASTAAAIKIDQLDTLDAAIQVYKTSGDAQPMFNMIGANSGQMIWGAGGSTAGDVSLYRSAADRLKTDDAFHAVDGVVTYVRAGTIGDSVFNTTPLSGQIALDSTNSTLNVRVGTTWKKVTLT